jgi:predicted transcriptional regulator
MNSKELLELYDGVKDDLKFVSSSSIRTKILISLSESKLGLGELKELLGLESSTILHGMRKLEDNKLINKEGSKYCLSQTGKIISLKLTETIKTLFVTKQNEKIWLNHEIEGVPYELLMKMGDLHSSKLVISDPTDILKPFKAFDEVLNESKVIKSISSIFDPHYIGIFKKVLLKNGAEVDIILTEQVLKKMMDNLDLECLIKLRKLMKDDKFKVWNIENNLKVIFTVTDKFMYLGLFSTTGEYDSTKYLISEDPDALAWGNSLFDYYRERADIFSSL